MFTQSIPRLGFACKYLDPDQSKKKKLLEESQRPLNTRSTTVAWLNRQTQEDAEQRLWDLMVHNIESYQRLIEYAGSLPENLRMLRLGSDCLPVYTEPTWSYFWRRSDVRDYCEKEFIKVGDAARRLDVRVSMHPGQFCCLASDNDDVIKRSIEEFEYHVDMIRWMGFGQEFQDFKCNVHLSGRGGTDTFRKSYAQLSPEARNVITIENDEYSSGLDKILEISDIVALVFDNHHHFIHSHGEHLLPSDEKIQKVIDSWRGVRPAMHYSVSKEEYLDLQDSNSLPNFDHFIDKGIKKGKLRAHSDYYPNRALNKLIYQFWDHFDIMCESKNKNLASMRLYEDFLSKPI